MDKETIQIITGMKLGYYRAKAGIPTKDLAKAAKVSPSYINEIEKGKKSPSVGKLLELAKALGVSYDDLTSTRLDGTLSPLAAVLNSPMIQKFPFHIFGTSPRELLQLMGRHPNEMGVLARMLQELGRSYDLRMEHLFHTALRCYQMLHNNYFEDLEELADRFRKTHGLDPLEFVTHEHMRQALLSLTGFTILEKDPEELPESLRSQRYFMHRERKEIWLNKRLNSAQCGFVYARELGYHFLQIEDRPLTSPALENSSFAYVHNNFRASYFAGALLIPRKRFQKDIKRIFAMTNWEEAKDAILHLPTVYGVTPETTIYRLSELVPHYCRTKNVHFTKFTKKQGDPHVRLEKQLNMSKVHIPNGISLKEHFCSRWLSVVQLQKAEEIEGGGAIIEAQRSKFLDFGTEFFCITVAYRSTLHPDRVMSATLGFPLDPDLKSTIKFWSDPSIPYRELGQTCERCPLPPGHCHERQVDPDLYDREQTKITRREDLNTFLDIQPGIEE